MNLKISDEFEKYWINLKILNELKNKSMIFIISKRDIYFMEYNKNIW